MSIQRINNFLPQDNFEQLKKILFSNEFPYYLQSGVAYNSPDKNLGVLLTHSMIHDNGDIRSSELTNKLILYPIFDKLKEFDKDFFKVIRAKINLYPNQLNQIKNDFHIDANFTHKVLLFSVNTNNGYTDFEDTNIDPFPSVENSAIIFDGKLKHRSVIQTDTHVRINININYE